MGGILSAISGAGQAAGPYREQSLSRWERGRDHLLDLISKRHDETVVDPRNPQAGIMQKQELRDIHGKILGLRPGQDPTKLYQSAAEHLSIHPAADKLLEHHYGSGTPTKAPPGPAAPGQVPGIQPMQPSKAASMPPRGNVPAGPPLQMLPPPSDRDDDMPTASQPSTSPVQGGGMGGGGGAASPAQVAAPAPSAPQSQPSGGLDIPGMPHPRDVMDIMSSVVSPYGGTLSKTERELLSPVLQSEVSHNAALREKEETLQAERAVKQHGLHEAERLGYLANIPKPMADMIRMQAMTGIGMSPGMMSTMFAAPTKTHVDATDMSPEDKEANGIPPEGTGKYTVSRDRMHNLVGPAVQGWAGATTVTNEKGEQGKVSNNAALGPGGMTAPGGGPAMTPAQSTPRMLDLPSGQKGMSTAAEMRKGIAPVPTGGIVSGMVPSRSTGSSYTDEKGNVVSSRTTTKIPPVGGVAASTGVAGPAQISSSSSNTPSKIGQTIRPFNPSDRTDNLVRLIGKDASNEKLMTGKADKYKVTQRMAELGIDPNNVTSSMRERATNAKLILGHLNDVFKLIDEADKAGELGLIATRWNDFLTDKLGEDPTASHIFSRLSSHRKFLATAVSMAHGGLRGGSSEPVMKHWEATLSAKDAATLKAKLGSAKDWMEGYASMLPDEPKIKPVDGGSSSSGSSPKVVKWGRDASGNPIPISSPNQ